MYLTRWQMDERMWKATRKQDNLQGTFDPFLSLSACAKISHIRHSELYVLRLAALNPLVDDQLSYQNCFWDILGLYPAFNLSEAVGWNSSARLESTGFLASNSCHSCPASFLPGQKPQSTFHGCQAHSNRFTLVSGGCLPPTWQGGQTSWPRVNPQLFRTAEIDRSGALETPTFHRFHIIKIH